MLRLSVTDEPQQLVPSPFVPSPPSTVASLGCYDDLVIWPLLNCPYLELETPNPLFEFDVPARRGSLKFRFSVWGRHTKTPFIAPQMNWWEFSSYLQGLDENAKEPFLQQQIEDLKAQEYLLTRRLQRQSPPKGGGSIVSGLKKLFRKETPQPIVAAAAPDTTGLFFFTTAWEYVDLDLFFTMTRDVTVLEAVNEVCGSFTKEYHMSDTAEVRERTRAAKNVLSPFLWNMKSYEEFCPLRQQDEAGDELRDNGTFVYRNGVVWAANEAVTRTQWEARIRERLPDTERNTESTLARVAITSEVRREVWRRDEGRCTTCGSQERLEFDHIIPVALGGSNTARNIQLLCEPCNRRKGATLR